MSRELEFDGWWEGEVVYSCDCCGKRAKFRFDCEDIDYTAQRSELKSRGWLFTMVNVRWKDFDSEK